MYRIGDLPPVGQWVRLEIPAQVLGLVGTNVSGITLNYYDGQVWFDRVGIEYCTFTAAEPELPSTDTVWMEDSLPAGAGFAGGNWIWDTTKKASGTQSHTELPRAGYHGNYFYGGSAALPLATGEKLFMYVLPNPCDPPREIMLEIYDGANWNHRAYWGENLQQSGTDGTNSRRRLGDLPPPGVWTRLEIPAEQVGMAGSTVQGLAFGVYDGQVWFDRVGKTAAGTGMNQTIPATMISSAGEESPEVSEARAAAESKPVEGRFWRRLMRKMLRRPEAAPPVSFTVYAQLTPETNSTLEMKRYSFYTPELQLLAETSTSALTPWITNEYVWFNGEPLAQVNVPSGAIAYYFNDHLGAPILQTDATGAVVWRVERDPYGERYATRVGADRHQPLGLPGQEYDASSDRQYNIARWYRPSWGRYTQVDPAKAFRRGFLQESDYSYVMGNPLSNVDPLGLYSLSIYRRRLSRVPNKTQLPAVCKGQNSCTNFPTEEISASCLCECYKGSWNMKISVEIAYDMYLAAGGPPNDPWHDQHELLHVEDIVDGLDNFLSVQERVSFSSQADCERNCIRIRDSIDNAVDSIARRSQQLRK